MAIIKIASEAERVILMIVTGLSNLPIIFTLTVPVRRQSYFHTFVGWFTLFISIFYHCTEALPSQEFILHEGNWHRLDNIGSITSFTLLMIYLMDISNYANIRAFFELFQFGITLLIQERAPWDLINTLAPILFWFSICLIKHILCYIVYNQKPNFHWTNFKIGWSIMLLAALFFAKGLDDRNDYLRLYHSTWHLLITVASYWLWQIVETENTKNKLK
eukprot:440495_1